MPGQRLGGKAVNALLKRMAERSIAISRQKADNFLHKTE